MSLATLEPADLTERLRAVLRGMPSPVALITTRDLISEEPAGLVASAIIPVSMAPPSMLVCVNQQASAHTIIEASGQFCINLIGAGQTAIAHAFSSSTSRDQRFKTGDWVKRHGLPYLPAAPASLFCVVRTTLLFGTHEAFVGEVFDIAANGAEQPLGWLHGAFANFKPYTSVCQPSSDKNGAFS